MKTGVAEDVTAVVVGIPLEVAVVGATVMLLVDGSSVDELLEADVV